MTEQATACAVGLAQAGHGSHRSMAPHRPPQRVIEGVRAGLAAIMKPENAPTYQEAQDLCIGLRLSLLQAARQAGETAAAPDALCAEARGAIRPLLERIGLGARREYLDGSAAEQAAGLAPVMEAVLLGCRSRTRYGAVLEAAEGLERLLADEGPDTSAPSQQGSARSLGSWQVVDQDDYPGEVAHLGGYTPLMTD